MLPSSILDRTTTPGLRRIDPPRINLDSSDESPYEHEYGSAGYSPEHYARATLASLKESLEVSSRILDEVGVGSPDSPTLGSSAGHPSPTISGTTAVGGADRERDRERIAGSGSSDSETGEVSRRRRWGGSRHGAGGRMGSRTETQAGASPPHVVDPATIPIRTSSSRATSQNSEAGGTRHSIASDFPLPPSSPRRHRSLMMTSVPEEREKRGGHRASMGTSTTASPDERVWLAATSSRGHPNGGSHSHYQRLIDPDLRSASSSKHAATPSTSTLSRPPTRDAPAQSSFLHPTASPQHPPPTAGWTPEKENILTAPFDYLESHPGKDIRARLIHAFNTYLRVPAPSLAIITKVVSMLHTASLLIDDVEDSSSLRRGVPVAHHIFGAAQTINSANYVYFLALQELGKLRNPECVGIYTEELLNLHRGQGMDLFWRDTLTCPSEEDYLEMVGNKTGGLFRLAVKLMCAESPSHNFPSAPPAAGVDRPADLRGPTAPDEKCVTPDGKTDYIPLVNTIGLLFQILDDYRNLCHPTYTANKGLCEDLTEGKFSFPIIHSIRAAPSSLVLINILKQRTQDEDVKRFAVKYMEGTGSFGYTRRVLRGLTRKALELVGVVEARIGASPGAAGEAEEGGGIREILEGLRVDKGEKGARPSEGNGK